MQRTQIARHATKNKMQKTFFLLLATCWLFSCNKVIEEVELPPFSVSPNPFTNFVNIYFDGQRYPNSAAVIRVLDGKEKPLVSMETLTTNALAVDLSSYDAGIYYLEMEVEGQSFTLPILKTE